MNGMIKRATAIHRPSSLSWVHGWLLDPLSNDLTDNLLKEADVQEDEYDFADAESSLEKEEEAEDTDEDEEVEAEEELLQLQEKGKL